MRNTVINLIAISFLTLLATACVSSSDDRQPANVRQRPFYCSATRVPAAKHKAYEGCKIIRGKHRSATRIYSNVTEVACSNFCEKARTQYAEQKDSDKSVR